MSLSQEDVVRAAIEVLDDHGLAGDTLETQSERARGLEEAPGESEIALEVRTGRYPTLQAAAEVFRTEGSFDEARFEAGLELLIIGMRARVRDQEGRPARP